MTAMEHFLYSLLYLFSSQLLFSCLLALILCVVLYHVWSMNDITYWVFYSEVANKKKQAIMAEIKLLFLLISYQLINVRVFKRTIDMPVSTVMRTMCCIVC